MTTQQLQRCYYMQFFIDSHVNDELIDWVQLILIVQPWTNGHFYTLLVTITITFTINVLYAAN